MLTADLVLARRRGDKLLLRPLDARRRPLALELATRYLAAAESCLGQTREQFEACCAGAEVPPTEQRLADGLLKLVTDRCTFAMEPGPEPTELRQQVFRRASELRRQLPPHEPFLRETVLEEVASRHELSATALEERLYADLSAAHRLLTFEPIAPQQLVDSFDLAQGQAVLLRARRMTVTVQGASVGAYRALFQRMKFLQLICVIRAREEGGYDLEIDGPMSMFTSATRYGLQLALLLPALQECGPWQLEAEVVWGKDRQPLQFHLESTLLVSPESARGVHVDDPPRLSSEVSTLLDQFRALDTPWDAQPSSHILDLPGEGLCVPDLVFTHKTSGEQVFLEVMGFWSRAAVWRRVELVQAGLPYRIVFAVSSRLRVSEAALDTELPGSLYVYKGVMNARRIAERLGAK